LKVKSVFKLNIVIKVMADEMMVKELEEVVVRFSGDSGDGMQLAGNIFSNVSATVGNDICTFPDYPADIRAPQGSLTGVSGFQVHIGAGQVYTPGDRCHVLVAMNPSALKTQIKFCKPQGLIITDSDSFEARDLEKAQFKTDNPFEELGVKQEVLEVPISSMCKESLKDSGLDNKSILRCKNMFALGLVCWLFNRSLAAAEKMLREKFAKKPEIAEANIKVLNDGYNYGANTHASTSTYKIESKAPKSKGLYTDINGNKATSYGLIAAAEKAGLELYLGSYPITPATDILHELSKHKSLGVKTVQCEDEIAGCASAVGAAFAGALAVTTTSGPGVCLKSEAMNLAVIGELPLVIVNVQRGGPSTGLPTKSEQTDLLQALYGRNGESPMPVIAATSPTNCFDAAYMAAKIALEHMTPVVLLTDAFVANGSAAWKLPNLDEYPAIKPPYVTPDMAGNWTPYQRNAETGARYWAIPGTEGFMHRIGGLEKSNENGAISTEPENHNKMVHLRQAKVDKIADYIPELEVLGDKDADLLIVGWGGTYGHLRLAMDFMRDHGKKVAFAHFQYINPLPKNTADVLRKYKKIVVAEQNLGQFAGYLRMKIPGLNISQFNQVKGQPFVTRELIDAFTKLLEE
jgi:2-oxoglutarate ferredoxin oxidoreductase subunit alpha